MKVNVESPIDFNENECVLNAIVVTIVSKLTEVDSKLFDFILEDYFPSIATSLKPKLVLNTEILSICAKRDLNPSQHLLYKCGQIVNLNTYQFG